MCLVNSLALLLQGLQFVDAKISLKRMFDAIAKSDESNNSKITSGIKPMTKLCILVL